MPIKLPRVRTCRSALAKMFSVAWTPRYVRLGVWDVCEVEGRSILAMVLPRDLPRPH